MDLICSWILHCWTFTLFLQAISKNQPKKCILVVNMSSFSWSETTNIQTNKGYWAGCRLFCFSQRMEHPIPSDPLHEDSSSTSVNSWAVKVSCSLMAVIKLLSCGHVSKTASRLPMSKLKSRLKLVWDLTYQPKKSESYSGCKSEKIDIPTKQVKR